MDVIANMNNERAHSQSEANAKPNAKAGATSQIKGDLGHKGDPYSLSAQRKCREVMRIGSPPSWRSRAPGEQAITMSGNDIAKSGAGDVGSLASAAATPRLETASRKHKRSVIFFS